jgi:hypothetical protein
MMRVFSIALALVLALAASGPSTGVAGSVRELLPFDAKSLESIRQTHAGRAFVLALWSIHCEPCREEMAEWNALRRKYPKVPVVLVSSDVPAERAKVLEFLARYDPGPVEAWMFADEFTERVRYAIDRTWRGELPRTYLFDSQHRADARSGRLERRWIEAWLARQ